jgi:hypothetical protein
MYKEAILKPHWLEPVAESESEGYGSEGISLKLPFLHLLKTENSYTDIIF